MGSPMPMNPDATPRGRRGKPAHDAAGSKMRPGIRVPFLPGFDSGDSIGAALDKPIGL
jgi:hypothetical protein